MDFSPLPCSCCGPEALSRRDFLRTAGAAAVAALIAPGAAGESPDRDSPPFVPFPGVPIVDLHQHCLYTQRPDDKLILHQRNTGIRTTILLPAGDPGAPGNESAGNDHTLAFAREHSDRFAFFTSVNTAWPEAAKMMELYLKAGAAGLGELKNQVACDSPGIERAAELAREYDVPMLLHFQDYEPKTKIGYNDGFVRFYRILEKFPTVRFIAHAQSFWAHVDRNYRPEQGLYPRGPVTPGGLTDRWLTDYPNFYGDLSAGSGNGALARDSDFARAFLVRHQDKLMYGSDCNCWTGVGPACIAAVKQGFLKELCPEPAVRDKLLFGNARKLVRFSSRQVAPA